MNFGKFLRTPVLQTTDRPLLSRIILEIHLRRSWQILTKTFKLNLYPFPEILFSDMNPNFITLYYILLYYIILYYIVKPKFCGRYITILVLFDSKSICRPNISFHGLGNSRSSWPSSTFVTLVAAITPRDFFLPPELSLLLLKQITISKGLFTAFRL